jgi:threonine/homoserine/homoserine lactone efflux protein
MPPTVVLLFLATAFVAIATPGPTVLLALSNGARFGIRFAVYGMVGAMLSDLILIAAVALGLGALLATSEVAFQTVKWLGVLYLGYLGVHLLRAQPHAPFSELDEAHARAPQPIRIFGKCLLVALTNPKGYLFFSAILPQFINPHAAQAPQYLILALTFAMVDGMVMFGYAGSGARAVQLLRTSRTVVWINRLSGGALLTLAGALALYRRAHD